MAVVESGLEAGQPVVVRGNEVLNDGDAVRIVETAVDAPGAPGAGGG